MISSATKCHLEKWRCYCHDRRQFSFNNNRKNSNKHWVTCFSANLKHHEAVDYQMDVYDEFERSDSVNMSIAVHKVVKRYVSMVEFIFWYVYVSFCFKTHVQLSHWSHSTQNHPVMSCENFSFKTHVQLWHWSHSTQIHPVMCETSASRLICNFGIRVIPCKIIQWYTKTSSAPRLLEHPENV